MRAFNMLRSLKFLLLMVVCADRTSSMDILDPVLCAAVINSRISVPALFSHEIHFGVAGPSITAVLRGAPLKAGFFIYITSIFQFTVRPEIRGTEDPQRKNHFDFPGETNDQAARLILAKLGLESVRDVKFIAIGDAKARVIAMEAGQIAAAANNSDVAAELVGEGFRNLLHSVDVFPMPFSGTAVNDRSIRENPDLIKRWLRSHVRALVFIRQRPDEPGQIVTKYPKVNPHVAGRAVV